MNYLDFRNKMFNLGCFSNNQVYAWQPDFDKNNLGRWVQKGWLVRLKNGMYSFTENLQQPDYAYYVANRMYRPSYISLHTALAFYGMIPESVVQITSVTTLKTIEFTNSFGIFSYKSIRKDLMFGYDLKEFSDGRMLLFAKPEKALLDLLYLYSFYNKEIELENLRLDEDFMQNEIDIELLKTYCDRINNHALQKRLNLLIKTYML